MRRTLWVIALLAGCKGSSPTPTAGQAMASLTGYRDQMCACKTAECVRQVAEQMAAWSAKQPTEKPAAMSAAEQAKATKLSNEIGECMLAASAGSGSSASGSGAATGSASGSATGSASGSGTATGSASVAGVPAECDEYKRAVDKLMTCEAIAKAAREQLVSQYASASKNWAAMPEASRATMGEACKAARDSVLAAGKAQCGW